MPVNVGKGILNFSAPLFRDRSEEGSSFYSRCQKESANPILCWFSPFSVIPAQAGTQSWDVVGLIPISPFFVVHAPLGPRFRGDDKQRILSWDTKILLKRQKR
jgi:hypothetical protein